MEPFIEPKIQELPSYNIFDYYTDSLTSTIKFLKSGMHPQTKAGLEKLLDSLELSRTLLPDSPEIRNYHRLAVHLVKQKLETYQYQRLGILQWIIQTRSHYN